MCAGYGGRHREVWLAQSTGPGWQGLSNARAAGEAGTPLGPASTGPLPVSSLPFFSPGSLTHSLSNFSGSFMHLPAPSHARRSLMGGLLSSLTLLISQTPPGL